MGVLVISRQKLIFLVLRCWLSTLGPRTFFVASPLLWNLYQTAWEIQILAGTTSDVSWRRIYLHCTEAFSVMIRSTNWLIIRNDRQLTLTQNVSCLILFYLSFGRCLAAGLQVLFRANSCGCCSTMAAVLRLSVSFIQIHCWVLCRVIISAGGDAKSQHRRAIVNLQATLVEHEEQLKDMERRTVAVSPEFTELTYVLDRMSECMCVYAHVVC